MPKPSMEQMLPDAATESTGGALAGKFEVIDAHYAVTKDHKEYEPKPGQKPDTRPNPNIVALVFKITPISDEGDRLEDADTRDLPLKLGGKSLAMFHPGKASSADDTDPDDLGDELGTEGNTLYISGGEVSMHAKAGYTVFMKSLQHRGFPKEKIAQCYATNFVGLKFELATVKPDMLEKYGQKNGEVTAGMESVTYKVVENLIQLPQAKADKKSKAATAHATAAKKNGAPAVPVVEANADGEDDAEVEAIRVLSAVAAQLSGKPKEISKAKMFWQTLYDSPKVEGNKKLKGAAKKFVDNVEWFTEQLELLGSVDTDAGTVTFN